MDIAIDLDEWKDIVLRDVSLREVPEAIVYEFFDELDEELD